MEPRERGRGAYRILWIAALAAIGVQLAMAREPPHRPLSSILAWEEYEWEAGGFRLECPAGWRRQQASGYGRFGQEMLFSQSANNRARVRRVPLSGGERSLVLREDEGDQVLLGMHSSHVRALQNRLPGLESSEAEIGQMAGCFSVCSDVSYTKPGALGGEGSKIVGRCYTLMSRNDEFWLDFFGEEASWEGVLEPAYRRMIESFEVTDR